jgi:hypothetical protein
LDLWLISDFIFRNVAGDYSYVPLINVPQFAYGGLFLCSFNKCSWNIAHLTLQIDSKKKWCLDLWLISDFIFRNVCSVQVCAYRWERRYALEFDSCFQWQHRLCNSRTIT